MSLPDDDSETIFFEPEKSQNLAPNSSKQTVDDPGSVVPSISSEVVNKNLLQLTPGYCLEDFEIQKILGKGSFGVVYLANQKSLNRFVALKITVTDKDKDLAAEGQMLAKLDHPSIVQVYFSQQIRDSNLGATYHLLCMQFINGTTLREKIEGLKSHKNGEWSGKDFLAAESQNRQQFFGAEEKAMKERDYFSRLDKDQCCCLIGMQAASALHYSHHQGLTHRDIKPANVMIDLAGRPKLIDFNLGASNTEDETTSDGGTLPYMPPETIASLTGEKQPQENANTADVYSLGATIWELATGSYPFAEFGVKSLRDPTRYPSLLESRKTPPSSEALEPNLQSVLQKAVSFDSNRRYQTAKQLGSAFAGAAKKSELDLFQKDQGLIGHWILRFPILLTVLIGFLPHIVMSVLQILYNQAEIVSKLGVHAQQNFDQSLLSVNVFLYSIAFVVVTVLLFQTFRFGVGPKRFESEDHVDWRDMRNKLVALPKKLALIGVLSWFSGLLVFPIILVATSGPIPQATWLHFLISFTFCGSIAVALSYGLTKAILFYSIYPRFRSTLAELTEDCQKDFQGFNRLWSRLAVFSGFVPLVGAVLEIAKLDPADFSTSDQQPWIAFKLLLVGLITLSVTSYWLLNRLDRFMNRFKNLCCDDNHSSVTG